MYKMSLVVSLVFLTLLVIIPIALGAEQPRIVSTTRIWDLAPHNAFTDLIRFQGRWWCVFREGQTHVAPDGALRIITSVDGETWESAALLRSASEDLRDGKLSITPDGKLMVTGVGWLNAKERQHQTYTWFSADGKVWSDPVPVGDLNYWLWRVTWSQGTGYGVAYGTKSRGTRLYSTVDGQHFDTLVKDLYMQGYPNETALAFMPDGTAFMLMRKDPVTGQSSSVQNAQLGVAKPPYTTWNWLDTKVRIGGPQMILLADGRLVATVRLYSPNRTALCWVNTETGQLKEFLTLPSGGDTSYAGMVWYDNLLWVSYYSSHQGKTSIYLSKVQIPAL